jgi:hypothetical protein
LLLATGGVETTDILGGEQCPSIKAAGRIRTNATREGSVL